jgi:hypothetical protein
VVGSGGRRGRRSWGNDEQDIVRTSWIKQSGCPVRCGGGLGDGVGWQVNREAICRCTEWMEAVASVAERWTSAGGRGGHVGHVVVAAFFCWEVIIVPSGNCCRQKVMERRGELMTALKRIKQ